RSGSRYLIDIDRICGKQSQLWDCLLSFLVGGVLNKHNSSKNRRKFSRFALIVSDYSEKT
ncbi:MAG: hypothetical protein QMB48_02870, partial [Burkholderiaceae bacterium]